MYMTYDQQTKTQTNTRDQRLKVETKDCCDIFHVLFKFILFKHFESSTFLTILGNIQINIFSFCLRHCKVQAE